MSDNIVVVDIDLEDLIPGFLNNRKSDISKIRTLLDFSDFDSIKSIGHSLKGVGGGYGFHEISRIGAEIEQAALSNSKENVLSMVDELEKHITSVQIKYE